ncbi:MAG TPA: hypothetical protein VGL08_04560, partial [Paraburkholderia sp.]
MAFENAVAAKRVALIEIRMPQEASTPGATLEQIREQGRSCAASDFIEPPQNATNPALQHRRVCSIPCQLNGRDDEPPLLYLNADS